MLFCPMCGAPFQVGTNVCRGCSAPLPATRPDLSAIEEAHAERSYGFTLAWSRFVQGFVITSQKRIVLVLPLLCAVLVVCLEQLYYIRLFRRAGGFGMGNGVLLGGNGTAMTWLMMHLDPAMLLSQSTSALSRLCLPVPTPPVYALLSLPTLPTAGMGGQALNWFAVWMFGLLGAMLNGFQWSLLSIATRQRRIRFADAFRRSSTVTDVILLLSFLPVISTAVTFVWRQQLTTPFTFAFLAWTISALLLGTLGAAKSMVGGSWNRTWFLWRQTFFSVEGCILLFLCTALLTGCQYVLSFWNYMMRPAFINGHFSLRFVTGIVVYVGYYAVQTAITQGVFCLMHTLTKRPENAALLVAPDLGPTSY